MSDIESTYNDIKDIMNWYKANSSITQTTVEEILEKRDKLAILSFRLSEIVGDAKSDYNSAYFMRIIYVAKSKQKYIENNLAYNKAEVKSIIESEAFYQEAIEKESIAFKNDMLLKGVNQVLSAMQQRISFAKQEKNNTF